MTVVPPPMCCQRSNANILQPLCADSIDTFNENHNRCNIHDCSPVRVGYNRHSAKTERAVQMHAILLSHFYEWMKKKNHECNLQHTKHVLVHLSEHARRQRVLMHCKYECNQIQRADRFAIGLERGTWRKKKIATDVVYVCPVLHEHSVDGVCLHGTCVKSAIDNPSPGNLERFHFPAEALPPF